jgi:RNA polymerase sigma-70 factor (ECF subfamily)
MAAAIATDDELLARRDMASFEVFYRRHFERLLAFFARRTRDPELAADLTAETFAAVLVARRRYRPGGGRADSWLYSIAYRKLADSQRRSHAERRACRRLGMEPPELTEDDLAWIDRLAEEHEAGDLVDRLPDDQRRAVRARVVEERSYADIAQTTGSTEAAVRQRVSRGLSTVRERMRGRA